jgi:uncharacterized membrane protein
MSYSHISLLGALAVATSSSVLAASAAQVEDLGSNFGLEASAAEVSLDGSAVIGTLDRNTNRTDGFRWTEDGGLEILEPLNGTSSRAYDVSDDGSFVAGDGSWFRAVR